MPWWSVGDDDRVMVRGETEQQRVGTVVEGLKRTNEGQPRCQRRAMRRASKCGPDQRSRLATCGRVDRTLVCWLRRCLPCAQMLKSEEHHERRHARLAGFTKHRFLAADQEQVQGMDEWKPAKKSFHVPTSLRLAGPESVQPLGPDMGTRRMRTLLREGRVKPHEGVGDILKNPFAFD